MSAPSDETSAITRTTEPKPGWWGSLVAQLTGRSVERTVEQDTTTSEEAPPAETELVEVTEPVQDQAPDIDSEVVDRHTAPVHDHDFIAAGRAWIGECVWAGMEPDYVAELTDDEVISGIARHYDGGVHAFEESGYDIVDEPLPFDVDENGFPTDHRTFQSHTLPDDTHSWLCGKDGCHNGAPEYTTPDESLAAAQEHEISNGYDRELEVAASVAVSELDEPEVAEALDNADTAVTIEDLEVVEPEREIKAHIVSMDGLTACTNEPAPDHAAEIVNPSDAEKCPLCVTWDKDCAHQLVMDLQDAQIADELEHPAEELDGQGGGVTIEDAVPIEELDDVVCELPGSEPEVAEPEVSEPEVPRPVLTDKEQLAVDWVELLKSGEVRQVHCAWTQPTIFGPDKKCAMQAAFDEFDENYTSMAAKFGGDLVDGVLHRNDALKEDFDAIGDYVARKTGVEHLIDKEMER